MEYSASPKDRLYVLTALSIFEHYWRKFYDPIATTKKKLLQAHNANQTSLDECEIKSDWIRISNTSRGKVDGLKIFPDSSLLIFWWEKAKSSLRRLDCLLMFSGTDPIELTSSTEHCFNKHPFN